MKDVRKRICAALEKPDASDRHCIGDDVFDPWSDVVQGIDGCYSSQSDDLMIAALEAVRDRSTFEYINKEGFAGEFMLYVLSGHNLLECGSSPRGGWPDPDVADLWDDLIAKWKAYYAVQWEQQEGSGG